MFVCKMAVEGQTREHNFATLNEAFGFAFGEALAGRGNPISIESAGSLVMDRVAILGRGCAEARMDEQTASRVDKVSKASENPRATKQPPEPLRLRMADRNRRGKTAAQLLSEE